MMFSGADALKKISVLSGGEKSRVMLGKLRATPVNLLLLDGPTNHLDMESCDALLAAIDYFEGTVIMVTHNEMFLHTLADKLIVFQNDEIEVFDGRYQEFLENSGWKDEKPTDLKDRSQVSPAGANARAAKKEIRRKRSEIMTRRSQTVSPLEKRIARIENDIESQEAELEDLNNYMQQASQDQDGARISELSQSIHTCQSNIDTLFEELETASDELDSQKAVFERELRQVDANQVV
jgi:ATP-binding cassette subfamily F protein 3